MAVPKPVEGLQVAEPSGRALARLSQRHCVALRRAGRKEGGGSGSARGLP